MTAQVHLEVAAGVATITLANAATRNAIDRPLTEAMCERLRQVAQAPDVAAILVRADGPAWCVGGSIRLFEAAGDDVHDVVSAFAEPLNTWVTLLHECPKITIAAVHGAVGGGGIGVMLAHDVVLAADDTVFVLGYGRLGANPDAGTSYFLARDVGYRRALDLYLGNERIDADRALALGMINRVLPAAELRAAAAAQAARIAAGPRQAYATTKRLLRQAGDGHLARQLDDEIRSFADHSRTADFREGVRAFLEKRPPRFGGPEPGSAPSA